MKQRNMSLAPLTVAAVAIALVAASYPSPAAAADCEVKIGALGPLSGGAAAWGLALRSGVEFAVEEANKAGGLPVGSDKCRVTVTSYDTKYTADGAAAAANFLASQNVKLIVGPVGSPEATGIKPVAERNGQITFNSAYAKDAIGPQWPLAFHQLAGPSTWAEPMVKFAKSKFDMKSVALVAPNDQGGTDIASVNAQAYRAHGVQATEEYYQRGTTNFAPIVTRILNARPDVVDTASSPPGDAATMVKQLREAGFTGPIGRLGGPGTQEIIRAVGGLEALKDFYWLELVAIDDPQVRAMLTDYEKVMGKPAPDNTLMFTAVSAARMLLKAISKAGTSTDVKKVAEALRALPVEDPNLGKGAWTGQKFYGANQELSFPIGAGLIQGGKHMGVQKVDLTPTN